jgi:catechol 2,3-dioxygenase-like lactoylglutathione lyase family enzyme
MNVVGIDTIKHHVRDWSAAIAFYRDVLGLTLVHESPVVGAVSNGGWKSSGPT